MMVIKPTGVAYIEMAHELRKIGSHGLNEKMEMIGHHYVCIENHLIGLQGNREQLKKPIPVLIIYENLPSLIASACHVIECTRELNSQWS